MKKHVDSIRKRQQSGERKASLMQIVVTIILAIMLVDFLGFLSWKVGNQIPADNFFIGSITNQLLK